MQGKSPAELRQPLRKLPDVASAHHFRSPLGLIAGLSYGEAPIGRLSAPTTTPIWPPRFGPPQNGIVVVALGALNVAVLQIGISILKPDSFAVTVSAEVPAVVVTVGVRPRLVL